MRYQNNIILNADSYKISMTVQYPPGTTHVYSYVESRGSQDGADRLVFFGLQAFIKEYLLKLVTQADIDEAEPIWKAHGMPFNREGWEYIVNKLGGRLPLEIRAVREGTVLPLHNVLVAVVNTDPNCFWLTTHVETALLRAIWYPTTVATYSHRCKLVIRNWLEKTSDDLAQIDFKLHDFGGRGVSSMESAALGGLAHLVNFKGSDTMSGVLAAREYYGEEMAAFSIPAAEHSTITSWGREHEDEAFENMLDHFARKGSVLAVVSDSYDIENAVTEIWGKKLRQNVINSEALLVVRPDSGNPPDIVLMCVEKLGEAFGFSTNSKGYKVLSPSVRVIQGDGINLDSINEILTNLARHGWAADNVAFGMGGALLQDHTRDDLKFAMKCSAICVNGVWRDVYKDPKTDPGKVSKKGRLMLIREGRWQTVPFVGNAWKSDELQAVYRDGKLLVETTLAEIRTRAAEPMFGEAERAAA